MVERVEVSVIRNRAIVETTWIDLGREYLASNVIGEFLLELFTILDVDVKNSVCWAIGDFLEITIETKPLHFGVRNS